MVGDDIRDDVLGAQDAGFQVNINVVILIDVVTNISFYVFLTHSFFP